MMQVWADHIDALRTGGNVVAVGARISAQLTVAPRLIPERLDSLPGWRDIHHGVASTGGATDGRGNARLALLVDSR